MRQEKEINKFKGLFSSVKMDYRTPEWLYNLLNKEFHFDFDPCPYHNREMLKFDGLVSDWGKCNYVNPPYGREIGKWIKKGHSEWMKGKTVVFLIPSRTDTSYWHDYILQADEIRFIRDRLAFDGVGRAPFPSCIVVFKGGSYNQLLSE